MVLVALHHLEFLVAFQVHLHLEVGWSLVGVADLIIAFGLGISVIDEIFDLAPRSLITIDTGGLALAHTAVEGRQVILVNLLQKVITGIFAGYYDFVFGHGLHTLTYLGFPDAFEKHRGI